MYQAKPNNPTLAALLIGIATAFIAATTLFAKALGTDQFGPVMHPIQIVFGRFLFAFLSFSITVIILQPQLQRPHFGLHLIRTLGGWAGLVLMFASVAYIPLADATAISFLNPVFGMIFAIPLLGERVGKWRWLAAGIALTGAMILLRPTPTSFQPAALLALGAAFILGFELNIIKKLTQRESPFSILFVNNTIGLCIGGLAVIFVWEPPTVAQWGLMARADASFVAPFSYGTLIFAAIYDVIFYDVVPDFITIIGACVIINGALLLAWREGRRRISLSGEQDL